MGLDPISKYFETTTDEDFSLSFFLVIATSQERRVGNWTLYVQHPALSTPKVRKTLSRSVAVRVP